MATLNQNWLTEGLIDFEYKRYLLLAYLQETSKHFDEKKLYPKLSELVEHYRNLKIFSERKQSAVSDFPKEISRLDFEQFKVEYRQMFEDDELLKEIDNIVEFALPEMEKQLGLGKELFEEVEDKLAVFPVGILPLRNEEGYFFLSDFPKRLVSVYYYMLSVFENMEEKFRGLHTKFLFSYDISVSQSYESVKYKLIEQHRQLPNPATYAVEFKHSYPLPETMLPVAKRSLVRYITVSGR
ncbi:MAG: hypothetical protein KIS94_07355 [Chitinophagales bacterium]|nr:hypothetical protein [Chitinophagales bacterium]